MLARRVVSVARCCKAHAAPIRPTQCDISTGKVID